MSACAAPAQPVRRYTSPDANKSRFKACSQRNEKLFCLSGLYCNSDGKKNLHCSRVAATANLKTWSKEFPHLAAVDRCSDLLSKNQARGEAFALSCTVSLEVQWNLHVPVLCMLLWLACVSVLCSDDKMLVC